MRLYSQYNYTFKVPTYVLTRRYSDISKLFISEDGHETRVWHGID